MYLKETGLILASIFPFLVVCLLAARSQGGSSETPPCRHETILYKLESKPPPESKPLLESKPPLQCISDGQVCHRDPLFESKPRAYYPDYTVY